MNTIILENICVKANYSGIPSAVTIADGLPQSPLAYSDFEYISPTVTILQMKKKWKNKNWLGVVKHQWPGDEK